MDRRTLFLMVERLPEDRFEAAAQDLRAHLEGRVHPAVLAAWFAPVDDEPVTDAEIEAVARGRAAFREGRCIKHEERKRRRNVDPA